MSEHITRVSLDEAVSRDRTDWARLRSLSDDEIEHAAATDDDSFSLAADAHYVVAKDQQGGWNWKLVDAGGVVIATGGVSHASQAEARRREEVVENSPAAARPDARRRRARRRRGRRQGRRQALGRQGEGRSQEEGGGG